MPTNHAAFSITGHYISGDNFVELAKLVTSRKRYRSLMDFLTTNYRKRKFMFGDYRFSMLLNEIYGHQLDMMKKSSYRLLTLYFSTF